MQKIIKNKTKSILIMGILLSIGICNTGLAAGSSMSILPEVISEESLGYVFTIDVDVNPAGSEIFGAQYELQYNKNVLKATDQTKGALLTQDGVSSIEIVNSIDNDIGKIQYGEYRTGDPDIVGGISDSGVLASITFEVIGTGASALVLDNVILSNLTAQPISNIEINNGVYGNDYRLEGDVTNTGLPITGADAQLVAQHIVHSLVLTGEDAQAADVNDDMGPTSAHITGIDLQLIKQYIVHIINEFPGGQFIP